MGNVEIKDKWSERLINNLKANEWQKYFELFLRRVDRPCSFAIEARCAVVGSQKSAYGSCARSFLAARAASFWSSRGPRTATRERRTTPWAPCPTTISVPCSSRATRCRCKRCGEREAGRLCRWCSSSSCPAPTDHCRYLQPHACPLYQFSIWNALQSTRSTCTKLQMEKKVS